jgi:hypothetical protein
MATKRSTARRFELIYSQGRAKHGSRSESFDVTSSSRKLRSAMPAKSLAYGNEYLCAIERNQNGKYTVRIRAAFAQSAENNPGWQSAEDGWALSVYFLASSFNAAMKKLEESLQLLQKHEDRLRFWGVEHSDDPNMAGDLLRESGLKLDRRREYPRKVAELAVPRERVVPASLLAPVRRVLADCMAQERPSGVLAGD